MTPQEFVADAKAKAQAAVKAVEDFFTAHPDIQSEAANTLKNAANDLAQTATAEVEAHAPTDVQVVLDDAIKAAQDKLDALLDAKDALTGSKSTAEELHQ